MIVVLSGCAAPLQSTAWRATPPAELTHAVELDAVPFFPQERYQCGPAALATVLASSGAAVTADELAPQVYLPARQGSLQPELLAAARRYQRLPYVLEPDLAALLREVGAGHPVLVLQNLGLSWAPRWHYAVVVGYDLARDEVVLRSGTERRHRVSFKVFERTWRRGGAWAVAVLPPAELPATAQELPYLRTVTAFESLGQPALAATAYQAAARHWPTSIVAWFGLGNGLYAQGDYSGAAAAYRQVLSLAPGYAPALNNLAQTLADQGALTEAAAYASAALAAEDTPAYRETLRAIEARIAAAPH